MAWRLYTLPIVGTGASSLDPRRPKYLAQDAQYAGQPWAMMDYGQVPSALVAADLATPQHNALAANADVNAFPATLDTTVGAANLATVQARLEALRLPGTWVVATTTYRTIARELAGLMQFGQRYTALTAGEELIPATGVNLDTLWGALPALRRDHLLAAAIDLGYDTSGLTDTTPLRAILRNLAQQWGGRTFALGGLEF